MSRRIIFNISLIIVVLFSIVGCSSQKKSETSASASASEEKVLELKLAGQSPKDHPSTIALYDFADKVKEKTDGRVNVKVFPANQLGDYTTVFEEVGRGTIDLALIGLPSNLDKRTEMIFTPYMVSSYEGIEDHYGPESYVFNKIQEIVNGQGIQLLGFHANGFGGLGTVKKIDSLLEFGKEKGLLLRTAPMDTYSQPMKDIGFRTVTVPFADLYTALQTGVADGWSGGEASLNYFGFRDVIKYFYQTNDFFNADSLLLNKNIYDSLSEADRIVVEEAAKELMDNSFKTAQEYDKQYRDLMKQEGIEIIEFSDEELNQLAEYVRENTWPKLKDVLGDGIIDALTEELNK